jgi:hypothetical protein
MTSSLDETLERYGLQIIPEFSPVV